MQTAIPQTGQNIEIILYAVVILQLFSGVIIALGRLVYKRSADDIEKLFNFHTEQQKECGKCKERIAKLEAKNEAKP